MPFSTSVTGNASEGRWASVHGRASSPDGPTTSAPFPPITHPDSRLYGTTELPNTMEKMAGVAQDKMHKG